MKQHISKLWKKVWFWPVIVVVIIAVLCSFTACASITTKSVAIQSMAQVAPKTSVSPTVQATTPTPKKVTKKYNMARGANTTSRVVLTYDDCPRSVKEFKTAVNYASAQGIGLVLFAIGDCVKMYQKRGFDLVGYARARGIWVGNHSMTHPVLNSPSPTAIKKQIGGVVVSNYGRPPYGAINAKVRKVYAQLGMHPWTWTVDTNDWRGKTRAQIVAWAVKYARAGGTVLMHMQWHAFNPTAMSEIKAGLAKKGLKVCGIWRGEDRTGPIEATTATFPDNIC